MSPAEAVEYGLIDQVLEGRSETPEGVHPTPTVRTE